MIAAFQAQSSPLLVAEQRKVVELSRLRSPRLPCERNAIDSAELRETIRYRRDVFLQTTIGAIEESLRADIPGHIELLGGIRRPVPTLPGGVTTIFRSVIRSEIRAACFCIPKKKLSLDPELADPVPNVQTPLGEVSNTAIWAMVFAPVV